MTPEQVVLIATIAVACLLLFLLMSLPAYQAYRRGYNPIVWGLAGMFASNPIFILVVLAVVPHRSRVKLRQQFRDELDRKLGAVPGGLAESLPGIGRRAASSCPL